MRSNNIRNNTDREHFNRWNVIIEINILKNLKRVIEALFSTYVNTKDEAYFVCDFKD